MIPDLKWSLLLHSAILLSFTFLLTNGNVSNGAFFILFILSCIGSLKYKVIPQRSIGEIFLFFGLFAATSVSLIWRDEANLAELDSPSRLVAAYIVFCYLVSTKWRQDVLQYSLVFGSCVGMVLVFFVIDENMSRQIQGAHLSSGRFSTSNAAPNSLAGYIGLMLLVCFSGVARLRLNWSSLLVTGSSLPFIVMGFYVFLGTESRGPWVCFLIVCFVGLIFLLYLNFRHGLVLTFFFFLLCLIFTSSDWFAIRSDRIISSINEILDFLNTGTNVSSGGARLEMLSMSIEIFSAKPLVGFGSDGHSHYASYLGALSGYGTEATNLLLTGAGPHNELAARSLQSGIWGLLATLFLLAYPVYRFGIQTLKAKDEGQRELSFMGFIVFTYIFLLSFVLEPYSLKHTATFNALLLAVLLGATAKQSQSALPIGTTTASNQMEPDRTRV